jgi:hypothetical protein
MMEQEGIIIQEYEMGIFKMNIKVIRTQYALLSTTEIAHILRHVSCKETSIFMTMSACRCLLYLYYKTSLLFKKWWCFRCASSSL